MFPFIYGPRFICEQHQHLCPSSYSLDYPLETATTTVHHHELSSALSLFPKTKEQLANNTHSPTPHYSLANSLSLSWAPPAVNSCSLPCVYPFLSGRTTTSESELKFRPRWIFLNRSSSFWQPFCLFNKSRSDPCFVRIGLVGGWVDGWMVCYYSFMRFNWWPSLFHPLLVGSVRQ